MDGAVGDCVLNFFFGGLTEVDVAGGDLVMIGDGRMVAVFCVRSCVMCCLGVSGRVCVGGGDISFSGVGCRRAGVDLVVGLAAAAGWRGHSPAEGAGCLLLTAPSCRILVLVDSCERLVQPERSPFRRTFSRVESRQSYTLVKR